MIRFGSKRQGIGYIVTTQPAAHGEALCLSVNLTAETDTSDLRSSPLNKIVLTASVALTAVTVCFYSLPVDLREHDRM